MAESTGIEWADSTFNPWIGCTKVGPGCDHCYAEARMDNRLHVVKWGPGQPRKRTSAANWRQPIAWDEQAAREGRRRRVFCASLADVFDNEVPAEWRADLFDLILRTPHLDWLLLTKRVGNVVSMLPATVNRFADVFPNVWIGATVVNQAETDRDIPKLLRVPARVRFLSIEPLLGPIEFSNVTKRADCVAQLGKSALSGVDWVIVGGESGSKARPMHPDWVRSLRDQCAAAGVPFFFKQHGEWIGVPDLRWLPGGSGPGFGAFDHYPFDQEAEAVRVGKSRAGRLLDGREWNEVPA